MVETETINPGGQSERQDDSMTVHERPPPALKLHAGGRSRLHGLRRTETALFCSNAQGSLGDLL